MRTLKVVALTVIALGFLALAALFLIGYFQPKPGGILVTSTPVASVYVAGAYVGKTPYEGTFKPGTYLVRLVADAAEKNYVPYETQVTLVPGIKTVVRRELAENWDASAGEIVSFEKEKGGLSSLVVVADPDNAQISLDGVPRGFSPYRQANVVTGQHQVAINSPGFAERALTVNIVAGYRLTVQAKLAKVADEPKVESVATEVKTFVEILETPTGFLRVRSEPGAAGREIHQVRPGEKYLFLEEDSATGWFKIQIEEPKTGLPEGRSGWISNKYSRKVEEETPLDQAGLQIPVTETPE